MNRRSTSLKTRITFWFAGIFFLLYAAVVVGILDFESRVARKQLEVLLYAEAEALASYFAATGNLDFPELEATEEEAPAWVWVRILEKGQVVASTPGAPDLGLAPTSSSPEKLLRYQAEAGGYAAVRHSVWNRPDTFAEALMPLSTLREQNRRLLTRLLLIGLFLGPLVALGGWLLADRALRPTERLIASIRALDLGNLEGRLAAPGAPREIGDLAREFNLLLGRLEQALRRMKRFTADASHELRTPITVLRTSFEVALRRSPDPEEDRIVLRESLQEVKRVQRIVEGLLALARADSGQPEPVMRTPVALAALAAAATASLEPLAQKKEVRFVCELDEDIQVLGDEDRLRLMIVNLLDNAVRHSPLGRPIHLSLTLRNGSAVLTIADQGAGVRPEDRPHLFERFYRGDGIPSSNSRTGGLGLSVVRWVAQSHGGAVRLLEDSPEGAHFEVTLPVL